MTYKLRWLFLLLLLLGLLLLTSGCANSKPPLLPLVVPGPALATFPYVRPASRPQPTYLNDFDKLDESMQQQLKTLLQKETHAKPGPEPSPTR